LPDDFSKPIPTKFSPSELEFLDALTKRTRLSRSEIIRRAVWLLKREAEASGNIHSFLGALGDFRQATLDSSPVVSKGPQFKHITGHLPPHNQDAPA
jgi:hypothetical protein